MGRLAAVHKVHRRHVLVGHAAAVAVGHLGARLDRSNISVDLGRRGVSTKRQYLWFGVAADMVLAIAVPHTVFDHRLDHDLGLIVGRRRGGRRVVDYGGFVRDDGPGACGGEGDARLPENVSGGVGAGIDRDPDVELAGRKVKGRIFERVGPEVLQRGLIVVGQQHAADGNACGDLGGDDVIIGGGVAEVDRLALANLLHDPFAGHVVDDHGHLDGPLSTVRVVDWFGGGLRFHSLLDHDLGLIVGRRRGGRRVVDYGGFVRDDGPGACGGEGDARLPENVSGGVGAGIDRDPDVELAGRKVKGRIFERVGPEVLQRGLIVVGQQHAADGNACGDLGGDDVIIGGGVAEVDRLALANLLHEPFAGHVVDDHGHLDGPLSTVRVVDWFGGGLRFHSLLDHDLGLIVGRRRGGRRVVDYGGFVRDDGPGACGGEGDARLPENVSGGVGAGIDRDPDVELAGRKVKGRIFERVGPEVLQRGLIVVGQQHAADGNACGDLGGDDVIIGGGVAEVDRLALANLLHDPFAGHVVDDHGHLDGPLSTVRVVDWFGGGLRFHSLLDHDLGLIVGRRRGGRRVVDYGGFVRDDGPGACGGEGDARLPENVSGGVGAGIDRDPDVELAGRKVKGRIFERVGPEVLQRGLIVVGQQHAADGNACGDLGGDDVIIGGGVAEVDRLALANLLHEPFAGHVVDDHGHLDGPLSTVRVVDWFGGGLRFHSLLDHDLGLIVGRRRGGRRVVDYGGFVRDDGPGACGGEGDARLPENVSGGVGAGIDRDPDVELAGRKVKGRIFERVGPEVLQRGLIVVGQQHAADGNACGDLGGDDVIIGGGVAEVDRLALANLLHDPFAGHVVDDHGHLDGPLSTVRVVDWFGGGLRFHSLLDHDLGLIVGRRRGGRRVVDYGGFVRDDGPGACGGEGDARLPENVSGGVGAGIDRDPDVELAGRKVKGRIFERVGPEVLQRGLIVVGQQHAADGNACGDLGGDDVIIGGGVAEVDRLALANLLHEPFAGHVVDDHGHLDGPLSTVRVVDWFGGGLRFHSLLDHDLGLIVGRRRGGRRVVDYGGFVRDDGPGACGGEGDARLPENVSGGVGAGIDRDPDVELAGRKVKGRIFERVGPEVLQRGLIVVGQQHAADGNACGDLGGDDVIIGGGVAEVDRLALANLLHDPFAGHVVDDHGHLDGPLSTVRVVDWFGGGLRFHSLLDHDLGLIVGRRRGGRRVVDYGGFVRDDGPGACGGEGDARLPENVSGGVGAGIDRDPDVELAGRKVKGRIFERVGPEVLQRGLIVVGQQHAADGNACGDLGGDDVIIGGGVAEVDRLALANLLHDPFAGHVVDDHGHLDGPLSTVRVVDWFGGGLRFHSLLDHDLGLIVGRRRGGRRVVDYGGFVRDDGPGACGGEGDARLPENVSGGVGAGIDRDPDVELAGRKVKGRIFERVGPEVLQRGLIVVGQQHAADGNACGDLGGDDVIIGGGVAEVDRLALANLLHDPFAGHVVDDHGHLDGPLSTVRVVDWFGGGLRFHSLLDHDLGLIVGRRRGGRRVVDYGGFVRDDGPGACGGEGDARLPENVSGGVGAGIDRDPDVELAGRKVKGRIFERVGPEVLQRGLIVVGQQHAADGNACGDLGGDDVIIGGGVAEVDRLALANLLHDPFAGHVVDDHGHLDGPLSTVRVVDWFGGGLRFHSLLDHDLGLIVGRRRGGRRVVDYGGFVRDDGPGACGGEGDARLPENVSGGVGAGIDRDPDVELAGRKVKGRIFERVGPEVLQRGLIVVGQQHAADGNACGDLGGDDVIIGGGVAEVDRLALANLLHDPFAGHVVDDHGHLDGPLSTVRVVDWFGGGLRFHSLLDHDLGLIVGRRRGGRRVVDYGGFVRDDGPGACGGEGDARLPENVSGGVGAGIDRDPDVELAGRKVKGRIFERVGPEVLQRGLIVVGQQHAADGNACGDLGGDDVIIGGGVAEVDRLALANLLHDPFAGHVVDDHGHLDGPLSTVRVVDWFGGGLRFHSLLDHDLGLIVGRRRGGRRVVDYGGFVRDDGPGACGGEGDARLPENVSGGVGAGIDRDPDVELAGRKVKGRIFERVGPEVLQRGLIVVGQQHAADGNACGDLGGDDVIIGGGVAEVDRLALANLLHDPFAGHVVDDHGHLDGPLSTVRVVDWFGGGLRFHSLLDHDLGLIVGRRRGGRRVVDYGGFVRDDGPGACGGEGDARLPENVSGGVGAGIDRDPDVELAGRKVKGRIFERVGPEVLQRGLIVVGQQHAADGNACGDLGGDDVIIGGGVAEVDRLALANLLHDPFAGHVVDDHGHLDGPLSTVRVVDWFGGGLRFHSLLDHDLGLIVGRRRGGRRVVDYGGFVRDDGPGACGGEGDARLPENVSGGVGAGIDRDPDVELAGRKVKGRIFERVGPEVLQRGLIVVGQQHAADGNACGDLGGDDVIIGGGVAEVDRLALANILHDPFAGHVVDDHGHLDGPLSTVRVVDWFGGGLRFHSLLDHDLGLIVGRRRGGRRVVDYGGFVRDDGPGACGGEGDARLPENVSGGVGAGIDRDPDVELAGRKVKGRIFERVGPEVLQRGLIVVGQQHAADGNACGDLGGDDVIIGGGVAEVDRLALANLLHDPFAGHVVDDHGHLDGPLSTVRVVDWFGGGLRFHSLLDHDLGLLVGRRRGGRRVVGYGGFVRDDGPGAWGGEGDARLPENVSGGVGAGIDREPDVELAGRKVKGRIFERVGPEVLQRGLIVVGQQHAADGNACGDLGGDDVIIGGGVAEVDRLALANILHDPFAGHVVDDHGHLDGPLSTVRVVDWFGG